MTIYKILLLSVTLSFFAQGSYSSELQTMLVKSQAMPVEHILEGTIEAVKQSTLSAEISGRISKINFDVNDPVKKGGLLLHIRDNEYQARLQQAEASLAEAEANLQDATLEFTRAKDMFKKNVISESQYDRANATVQAAKARVAASKAAVAIAKEQLKHTNITAPYTGIVIQRHVELGETVSPGTPLMTGYSANELRAMVDVPQTFIEAIRAHQKARVILLGDNKSISSKSLTIFPSADTQRHTVRVRVNLAEGLSNLYPGTLVKVAFFTDTSQRLLIPVKALVQRSEVNGVYMVDTEGKVKLRQVRLGHKNDNQIEILAGLVSGETIALDPVAAGILLKNQAGNAQ